MDKSGPGSPDGSKELSHRFEQVLSRIRIACQQAGRRETEVTLIAASKGQPPSALLDLWSLGHRDFGENYLQEALPKVKALPDACWHYLGRLQSNKVAKIAASFQWIHTISTKRQADLLATRCVSHVREAEALIEVNIAREPQKSGCLPEEVADLAAFVYNVPGLRFRGLMTMGPVNPNAEEARPYFRAMRGLLDGLNISGADCLSMGMSNDFDVAIQEGATHVRVGSALFGMRS